MAIVENNENVPEGEEKCVDRTQKIIDRANLDAEIIWHDVEGATTADARDSLGVDASDIAKSIVFIDEDGNPHMVIILGHKRIDTEKLGDIIGKEVRIASRKEVLDHTGTKVGGVTPIGCEHIPKYLDKTLLEKEYVHSSAGSSYATLKIKTEDLVDYIKGKVVDVAE